MSPPGRRRGTPASLARVLRSLAREVGDAPLGEVAEEVALTDVLGPWISARLASWRRHGEVLELELAAQACGEVQRHAREILGRLAGRLGAEAPRRLVLREAPAGFLREEAKAEARPRRPSPLRAPGPETREALEAIEDPTLRERLLRVAGRGGAHRR